jgi:hypothetical protein
MGYTLTLLGGAAMIFQNHFESNIYLIATFVLFAKFGASMCMCTCYVSTSYLFPVQSCGTAFGICNLVGRSISIYAPKIVELTIPLPMEIFTGIAALSIAASAAI